MTKDQEKVIQKAKDMFSLAFPHYHGSIQINLNPKVPKDKPMTAIVELDHGGGVKTKESVLVSN